jgi:hypothetical protein
MADAGPIPGAPTNPFRAEDATPPDAELYPLAPRAVEGGGGPDLRRFLGQRVREMNLPSGQLATPRAADLSVKDLNDLAAEFSGLQTNNPHLPELSLEDLNSLEAVFTDVKIQAAMAAREAALSGAAAPDWTVSCCCCTPCCSCAATDTTPFGQSRSDSDPGSKQTLMNERPRGLSNSA